MKSGDDHKRLALQQDKGYVLIVVLFVITLMLIASLSIIGVSLTRTQQNAHETFRVQATNAAEIGLKAYDQKISAAIQTINQQTPASSDQFKQLFSTYLPAADLSQTLNNVQNAPSYAVTVKPVTGTPTNEVKWTLTSVGNVNGVERTITQDKTFIYDQNKLQTQEFNGLTLPYMDGSVVVKTGNWNIRGEGNADNIHIYDNSNMDIQPTFVQNIDFDGIKNNFLKMQMAKPTTNLNAINGVSTSGNIYTDSQGNVYVDGDVTISGTVTFPENVQINGYLKVNGNLNVQGNLFVSGNNSGNDKGDLIVNGNIDVQGNLFVNNELDYNNGDKYEGYIYVGGDMERKDNKTAIDTVFERTVYVYGSFSPQGSNKSDIYFKQGVVLNGNATPQTSNKGDIYFYPEALGENTGLVQPVMVTTGDTTYQ